MTAAAPERIAEEIGDLLFAVVNLSRFLRIDPEAHLRIATEKFRRRFDHVAAMLRERGRSVEEAGLPELDRLCAAKEEERQGPPGPDDLFFGAALGASAPEQ